METTNCPRRFQRHLPAQALIVIPWPKGQYPGHPEVNIPQSAVPIQTELGSQVREDRGGEFCGQRAEGIGWLWLEGVGWWGTGGRGG